MLYNVTFTLTSVSLSTTVEAKDPEHAEILAGAVFWQELNVALIGSRYQVDVEEVETESVE